MTMSEKSEMEIVYEKYLSEKNRLLIFHDSILYKIVHKSTISLRDGTVLITIPWEVLSLGNGPYFDENGNQFNLGIPAHMSFRNNNGIPEWYTKTATVTVEGIHNSSEIGNYIGQKNKSIHWLKDSEIKQLLECRNRLFQNTSYIDLKTIYQILFDEGFVVMNPNTNYQDLSDESKRKRDLLLKAMNVTGNQLYNDPFLSCPVCKQKYVSHNIFDYDYPYIDTQMYKEQAFPLTHKRNDSEYKYYCLTCGLEFEIRNKPKKIFNFERGSHFGGSLDYSIWEMRDHMIFESNSGNEFSDMVDYLFCFPKEEMTELTSTLKTFTNWNSSYEANDDIYDGYGWHISFDYNGTFMNTQGYEAWPIGYKFKIKKLQKFIEQLCKRYAVDYSDDRINERLSL